jgi:threonine dehydrogenase-like Zn-dependent dehydrogenase
MGHEYCGIVEEVGSAVRSVKPGQFVIGSFATSDNTCPNCQYGYQSSCVQREFMSAAQAPYLRVPLVDGTLVATSDLPPKEPMVCFGRSLDGTQLNWTAGSGEKLIGQRQRPGNSNFKAYLN